MAETSPTPLPECHWRPKPEPHASPKRKRQKLERFSAFGIKAAIIDFLDDGSCTEFALLDDILNSGVEETMRKAFRKTCAERGDHPVCEKYTGDYQMRWIHIPSNNMEWVEVRHT
jgi:hypothetical protein